MVKKERKKTAIAYICLSVALLISTLLGISFAWFTDTATGSGSAQFGVIDLGTVTASNKTNVMPGDTMSNLGSFTYSANAESAYWRATYEITDNVSTELDNFVIEPEFGAISSSANLQTINLARTITIPTSLTNAYQEQTITIKITIDTIQQANLPISGSGASWTYTGNATVFESAPKAAFAYMDANNIDYVTGVEKVVAQTYAITKNTPANGAVAIDKASVTSGGSVVITITPNSGYKVSSFTINGVAVASANIINNTYTLTNVTSAQNIVVAFTKISGGGGGGGGGTTYAITKNTPANGTVALDKTSVISGESVVITITPNSGYEIGSLTINNVAISIANLTKNGSSYSYTITNVTSSKNIVVAFAATRYYTKGLEISGTTLTGIGTATLTESGGLTIPREVTEIGNGAFEQNADITTLSFEDGSNCTRIGDGAFAYSGLTEIFLPESVFILGYAAFFSTPLQGDIVLSTVVEIGDNAFMQCTQIHVVYTGSLLQKIGVGAFGGCDSLEAIIFEGYTIWYFTTDPAYNGGDQIGLDNPTNNANYFKTTYADYYWHK